MKIPLLPCVCGRKCRKRRVRVGVFNFKEIRCSLCGLSTQGEYTWLNPDDSLMREEWNQAVVKAR